MVRGDDTGCFQAQTFLCLGSGCRLVQFLAALLTAIIVSGLMSTAHADTPRAHHKWEPDGRAQSDPVIGRNTGTSHGGQQYADLGGEAILTCNQTVGSGADSRLGLAPSPAGDILRRFRASDGHVLEFSQRSIIVASSNHMLQMDFVGTRDVRPVSREGAAGVGGGTPPSFTRVTYADLWEGVTAVFEAHAGSILKSTYFIDATPDENPSDRIRLRYNRSLSVDSRGALVIACENGFMSESPPIAWQDIDGRRTFVQVSYVLPGDNEVGFCVGDYDRGRQLVIDPTLTWMTFVGGGGNDQVTTYGNSVAVDGGGNVY